VVALGTYFNALTNDFVYDDRSQVMENPWIRSPKHLPEIFGSSVWSFHTTEIVSNYYRPLMHVFYMLVFAVCGMKPWGFHLLNQLLHAGVSVLVFVFADIVCGEQRLTDRQRLKVAFVAALLFAVNPIHTEAVAWIAGLPEVSFSFFFLLALCLYVRAGNGHGARYWASVGLFFIATLCKETALVLPAALVAYDAVLQPWNRSRALRWLPFLAVAAGYVALRWHALGGLAPERRHAELTGLQLLVNVFPLLAAYLWKLVFPFGLNAFHVLHPVESLLEWKGLMSASVVATVGGAAYLARTRHRGAFMCLVLLLLPLLPVLYIPALGENTFAERYLYLPSAGFAVLVALAAAKLSAIHAGWTAAAIAVLVGLYSGGTVQRNAIWKDDYTLYRDTIEKSPDAVMIRYSLANALLDRGRVDEAIAHYQAALAGLPEDARARSNYGMALFKKGQLDEAIEQYQIALRLNPQLDSAHLNLGSAWIRKGLLVQGLEEYRIAIRLAPGSARAQYQLGTTLMESGRLSEALDPLRKAVELEPDLASAQKNLGAVLFRMGRLNEALQHYLLVEQLEPGSATAHANLGSVYGELGSLDRAIGEFQAAVDRDPGLADAWFGLGVAYKRKGLVQQAITHLETAARLSPEDVQIRRELATARAVAGAAREGTQEPMAIH